MDLLTLAERVEGAEGADRELDVLIGLAIDWNHGSAMTSLRGLQKIGMAVADIVEDAESPQMITSQLPRYTSSIDSAMSLLPQHGERAVFWRVGNDGEGGDPAAFKAQVLVCAGLTSRQSVSVADTPALALCAAALRARAKSPSGDPLP